MTSCESDLHAEWGDNTWPIRGGSILRGCHVRSYIAALRCFNVHRGRAARCHRTLGALLACLVREAVAYDVLARWRAACSAAAHSRARLTAYGPQLPSSKLRAIFF